MSYEATSAEVAEDYKLALEDLTSNLRHEISNLTLIARENTEHAHAISEVLIEHIKRAAPSKKLPALYVLDSIVKNVGTPYTLFFGRKLYQTFMDSYTLVDHNVRRKMDEMLKTWKEPVPGSMDSRPVFPPDVVRPIENALIKARTSALQAQQHISSRPPRPGPGQPYRETPTPPGMRPGLGPPPNYQQQPAPTNGRPGEQPQVLQPYPSHQTQPFPAAHSAPPPQLTNSTPAPFPPPAGLPLGMTSPPGAPAPISIESLNNDIASLIVATKADFAQSPYDASIQTRLKALLDLQGILQRQNLPQDQLVLIKDQVASLAVNMRPAAAAAAPSTAHGAIQTLPHHRPTPPPQSMGAAAAPPPAVAAQAPVTIDALLGQGALAALLARRSAAPQAPAPSPSPAFAGVAIRSPPPAQRAEPMAPLSATTRAAQPPDPMSLLGRLRQAGILPTTSASVPTTMPGLPLPPPPPPPAAGGPLPANLPPIIASMLAAQRAATTPGAGGPGVGVGGSRGPLDVMSGATLNVAALKQPCHPKLIAALYDDLGAPCSQCGRRFSNDEKGRQKKTAHMDWHFRVHQRITEAEKRGQHRSWYVDADDWSKSRETVDVDLASQPDGAESQSGGKASREPKLQYIPVPDPSSGVNGVCPICQEKFENKWLDSAQEWVWLDAVMVGNRAFHASCRTEATRDREGTPGGGLARGTPEPVLGKRKAESELQSSRGKIKVDSL